MSRPPGETVPGEIAIVGAGYVGLTAAACFAKHGQSVVCVDTDLEKVAELNNAVSPIHEPGLAELLAAGLESGRLRFATSAVAATECEFAFLCVQTPLGEDGKTDTTSLLKAATELGAVLPADSVVVSKSTVPVGGHKAIVAALARDDVSVAANPEFLSEGNAVNDFLNPDRVVIGADNQRTADRVAALYHWVKSPIIVTDPASAEVAKFAANAFLATKVSFVNELAAVCDALEANIDDVLQGVGADHRIGSAYLRPGPGWGGSCLPKDTRALVAATRDAGYVFDLLEGAIAANDQQLERVIQKIGAATGNPELAGLAVGVLGLTFKAGTDDLRGSPAVEIAQRLAARGALLRAYDPQVNASRVNAGTVTAALPPELADLQLCDSVAEIARDADVLVVLTEWPEFAECDWVAIAPLMKTARIIDARNLLDPTKMRESGFAYEGLGRRAR